MSDLPDIPKSRLDAEWSVDEDVLQSLARNGDQPYVPREIDVSFYGSKALLSALETAAAKYDFELQSWSERDSGEPWLFLKRVQPSDRQSIHELTHLCLQLAARFDVTHDGWGCVATNENGPISKENSA